MKLRTFLLCRILRRHQWKCIRPYTDFEVMFECRRCGMVWEPGVGVTDRRP